MSLSAGYLNKRVGLLKLVSGVDEVGQILQEYELVQTPWCRILEVKSTEVEGSRLTNNETIKIIMRYNKELENPNATFFITFNKRTYDIQKVINVLHMNEKFEVTCVLRSNNIIEYTSAINP